MRAAQIIERDVQAHGCQVAVNPLAEAVCEAREPTRSHADRKVLTFDVAGRNLRRHATYCVVFYSDYLCRGVTARRLVYVQVGYAVGLLHDAVRNTIAERIADRVLVEVQPV